MTAAKFIKNTQPFPSYFFSHGGPTFMYEHSPFGEPGAWKVIKELGTKIKHEWKPDYIIVVSAHWQSGGTNKVEVAIPPQKNSENQLIYDFYGFPDYTYKEEFHTKNNWNVANAIKDHFESNGFSSQLTVRGIDHGVWVPFKIAFSDYTTQSKNIPLEKGLDLPDTALIQVSLTADETDFKSHYKLGALLNHFRENLFYDESEGRYLKGLVITSGQSVHNLAHLRRPGTPIKAQPYTNMFNSLIFDAFNNSDDLLASFENIQKNDRNLLKLAHPTQEHFVPIVVFGGLSNDAHKQVKELYNFADGGLGWAIYQAGDDYKTKV